MERNFPRAVVTVKGEKALRGGHPWVFSEEVVSVSGEYENGDLVDVFSGKGRYLGTGFINDCSKIRIRLISRNANDTFDEAFWERRLRYAVDYRRCVMPGEDFLCCRLIFGEADCFPGLTVDRFGEVLSVQILSRGIERRRELLLSRLVSILREEGETVTAVYERSDSPLREKEGMEKRVGFFLGEGLTEGPESVLIKENGILYRVDYRNGQKTGFFLDQKYNRAAVARLARGKRVLDCFTHTGAFALNAAMAGAREVTAVDVSEEALSVARENAALNGLSDKVTFLCRDVFDLLTEMAAGKKGEYDLILLDPPAFTKSRETVKDAIRGYREINRRAMQLLPRGGYLATCSCSHFMTAPLFKQMLHDAANDAAVSLRQIEERRQSPDHPILWNVPETEYLKFFIFQVV